MPAGAVSMFGPGTKSLLSEGLKKRPLSTSEELEKSEEVWKDHFLKITAVCAGRRKALIGSRGQMVGGVSVLIIRSDL